MAQWIDVEEARGRSGLRLVLTVGVPGPWSEAAKSILHVKRLPYVRVRQELGGENRALAEWTGQTSAPVLAWNDEPPRTTSLAILLLAERLAPDPPLLPADPELRAQTIGLAHEIVGEQGLGWARRQVMMGTVLAQAGEAAPAGIRRMAVKYGCTPDAVRRATERVVELLGLFSRRLARQRAAGRRYLLGDRLSALDVYWATFAALFAPLPEDLCPMPAPIRRAYTLADGPIGDALDPALLAHRDFVYREHLELPVDCTDG